MKGIILAGGKGSRLYPATSVLSKQILPVYNKPMIYYPLSTLMLGGIREILIITSPESIDLFKALLLDGSQWGLSIEYAVQLEPNGLAEAFIIGEKFIDNSPCALILGDNIFYGDSLSKRLENICSLSNGAFVFASYVLDPERYGICEFDKENKPIQLVEKPKKPVSNWAVTGLYVYDGQVVQYTKQLKPSQRGELEITDLNNFYLKNNLLTVEKLGRGLVWFDMGTPESLSNASEFVRTIETRQRYKIACPEEIALRKNYIDRDEYAYCIKQYQNTDYGFYLQDILDEI